MVNAWNLLHSEMNGTMDEDYPIMSKENEYVGVATVYGADHPSQEFWAEDGHSVTGNPCPPSEDTINFGYGDLGSLATHSQSAGATQDTLTFTTGSTGTTMLGDAGMDTITFGSTYLVGGLGEDRISFGSTASYEYGFPSKTTEDSISLSYDAGAAHTAFDDPKYYGSSFGDDPYPTIGSYYYNTPHSFDTISFGTPPETKPAPNLTSSNTRKYEEDKSIKDLKDYVASTYNGHYTNEKSDVQTLDLIHSVGDAESFCRSNAIKYLSRYDKKGQAKRDILKAMHYCLLLYYFSGNTNNETPTRGYETF